MEMGVSDLAIDLSKEQLIDILELSPNTILAIDQENKIVFASKQTQMVLGYDRGELIGKNYEILVPDRFRMGIESYASII